MVKPLWFLCQPYFVNTIELAACLCCHTAVCKQVHKMAVHLNVQHLYATKLQPHVTSVAQICV